MENHGTNGYNNNNKVNGSRFIPKYVDPPREEDEHEDTELMQEGRSIENQTVTCCGIKWGDRYNPKFFNCIAYFCASLFFMLTVNIRTLPDLWYPTIGNLLLPLDLQHENTSRVHVLFFLWNIHFVRRFAEVLFVHIYRRGFKLHEAIGVIIYYSFFGLWIGWSINFHIGYRTPPNYLYVPGILVCFVGGCGNFICHLYLREMSLKRYRYGIATSESHHVLPDRCCFSIIACPHYLFEIITWVGFALTAFTLASWTFACVTFAVLILYSQLRHRAYQREFNGKNGLPYYDPKKRKALIPYIL